MEIPVYRYSNLDSRYTFRAEVPGKGNLPLAGVFTLMKDIKTAKFITAIDGDMFLQLNENDRFISAGELVEDGEQMGIGVYFANEVL